MIACWTLRVRPSTAGSLVARSTRATTPLTSTSRFVCLHLQLRPALDEALDLSSCPVFAGRGEQVALIWDSPVAKTVQKFTYKELHQQVTHFAGVLANNHGVEKGDRV